jgi:hypothetical protein
MPVFWWSRSIRPCPCCSKREIAVAKVAVDRR